MTAWNVGCMMFGIGLMGAFVDAATGLQIAKAVRKVLRGKTPHLRGRKPAECGVGIPSAMQVQEVTRVERFANRLPDVREQSGLASARAFHAWLDARRVSPPTVFEYEALREDWRRKQAAEVSPLDRARLAAWSASLSGEASVSLPMDQYRAALEHYLAGRVWRDPRELPQLYGVRLAVKVA